MIDSFGICVNKRQVQWSKIKCEATKGWLLCGGTDTTSYQQCFSIVLAPMAYVFYL